MDNKYIGTCTNCKKENVSVTVVDEMTHLCEECLDEDYFYCEECKQYWHYDFVEFYDLDDGRIVCEHCYEDIRADSTQGKLEALIHEISERDDFAIYEASSVYFIVSNDRITEISNDASCSPKGGWFPDIIKGLSYEENDMLELMMQKYNFPACFFDEYLSDCFDYDEETAMEYFEERSHEELAIYKRILEMIESDDNPYESVDELIALMKKYGLEEETLYYEWEGEWIPFYDNIVETGEERGYYESMSDEEWLRTLQNIDNYKVEGI